VVPSSGRFPFLVSCFGLLAATGSGCGSHDRRLQSSTFPPEPRGGFGGAGDAAQLAGAGGTSGAPQPPAPPLLDPMADEPCNGTPAYCSRRYDELCFPGSHDSAAYGQGLWKHPAQDRTVREQLAASIRVLMLSIHDLDGVATVCRQNCDEGNTPLEVVLRDLALFFADNGRQVVTLLIDSELSGRRLAEEFRAFELDALALTHIADKPWPTLGEMIDDGSRLVVLATTTDDDGPAWLLPRAELVWETGKDWPSLSAMNCNPELGDASRPLYLVHHYLGETAEHEAPGAAGAGGDGPTSAALGPRQQANQFTFLTERLQRCQAQHGHPPAFVAVDDTAVGDVVGATQVMNGVREP
jgi:hypothetical protein